MEPLIGNGGLLIKYHPGHDDSTDVGGYQHHVILISNGCMGQAVENILKIGVRDPGDPEKDQFKQAHDQGNALLSLIHI